MKLLGTITTTAGVAKTNLTTAVPFTIPAGTTICYYRASTNDCRYTSGLGSVAAAVAADFALTMNIAFPEAVSTDNVGSGTPLIVSVYSAGGGSVAVYTTVTT